MPDKQKRAKPHKLLPAAYDGDIPRCYVMIDRSLGARGNRLG